MNHDGGDDYYDDAMLLLWLPHLTEFITILNIFSSFYDANTALPLSFQALLRMYLLDRNISIFYNIYNCISPFYILF